MSASTALIFNIFARNQTGPGLNSVAGGFSKIKVAGAAAFVAVGAVIGSSIKKAADFDKTIRLAGTTAGASSAQMKELSDMALKVGTNSQFGAQGAADAMNELAKGGITIAQMKMGALAGTMTLASAGGLQLGAAATYMTNSLNTFGLSADKASTVAAALAGGANASTASVESLGMALSQVGPGAVNAGLSLQETVAALAAFDNAGIKGSDAGTSLKTMLARLIPPTKSAQKAADALGLSFTNSDGSFKSLAQIAQILQDKMGGLSEEQKTLRLQTLFGSDATRAASVLMKEGAAGIEKYTKATSDQSAAQKLAAAQTAGAAGAFAKFRSAVDTLQIAFGLHLLPAVTGLVGGLTGLINKVTSGVEPAFRAIGPTIQTAGRGLKVFFDAMSGHSELNEFSGGLQKMNNAGVRVFAAFRVVASFIRGEVIPTVQRMATTFSTQVWPAIVKVAGIIAHNLKPAFDAWINVVKTQVIPAVQRMIAAWKVAAPPILKVGAVLLVVASFILGKVLPALFKLEGLLIGAVSRALAVTVSTVGRVIAVLLRLGVMAGQAGAAIGRFASAVGSAVARAWSAVSSGIGRIITTIKGLPGRAAGAVGNLGNLLYQKGRDLVAGFVKGIGSMAGSIASTVKDKVIGAAKSAIHGFGLFGSPSKLTAKYGQWFGQGFVDGVTAMQPKIAEAAAGMIPAGPGGMSIPGAPGTRSLPAAHSGAGFAVGAQPTVRVVFDVTGADKEMKALLRRMVRVDGRGSAQVAFGAS